MTTENKSKSANANRVRLSTRGTELYREAHQKVRHPECENITDLSANTPSYGTLRRKAMRRGFRLTKIRKGSRWYGQYGPFMLSDAATNYALHYGLTAQEVANRLSKEAE